MFRRCKQVIAVLLVLSAVSTLAIQYARAAQPVILSATVNPTATQLTITGTNLCCKAANVMVGANGPLAVIAQPSAGEQLVVALPALSAGSYVLRVQIGTGAGESDKSVILIGATQPTGVPNCGAYPRMGVDLSGCDLPSFTIYYLNVTSAKFVGTNLQDAIFWSGQFDHTDFTGANLKGATIVGSTTFVNFTRADLRNAYFVVQDPAHQIWSGSNFTGANLTGALIYSDALANVIWSNTTCPDGTNSDSHGGTCVGFGTI